MSDLATRHPAAFSAGVKNVNNIFVCLSWNRIIKGTHTRVHTAFRAGVL